MPRSALASHIGLEGLSIGALAEVTRDEQVGRVRPLRLARGTADLGRARVPRQVRGRGVLPGAARAARPAAAARAVRPLDASASRSRSTPAASTSAARSSSTTGPGPVRDALVDDGADLAAGARARDPRRRSTKAICAPTPTPQQMLFEIHGLILALHHDARFLRHAGADRPRARRLRRVLVALRTPPHRRPRAARAAPQARADRLDLDSTPGAFHAPLHPAAARHAVRAARGAQRRRRAEGAAARTPTSTPTRSTRCSRKAASSPAEVLAPLNQSGDERRLHARQGDARGEDAEGLQGGLRAVRRRRLAGAQLRSGSTAARACRTS